MERSQVTPVALVLDTFNSAISAHGACAGLERGVTHKGRVQHKLPEFVWWVVIMCRACVHEGCHDKRARLQQDRCLPAGIYCIHAARMSSNLDFFSSGNCHFVWSSQTVPLSFLIASLRRMSANHCFEFVMVSFPAKCCRLFDQRQCHPAGWSH